MAVRWVTCGSAVRRIAKIADGEIFARPHDKGDTVIGAA
jgi:hypothetical protein